MPASLLTRFIPVFVGVLLALAPRWAAAQVVPAGPAILREVSLRTDTATYLLSRHTVPVQGVSTLYFWFRRDDETV